MKTTKHARRIVTLLATLATASASGVQDPPPGEPASTQEEDPVTIVGPQPESRSAIPDGRNRLGEETSPYLLQHKDNPVHWWAWGPEAFEAARAADRLIFLSVGYSTCYWCHVMERECFENEEIARLLNESYICIKVDREERPDVDDIYMAAVNILNDGQGGWPMTVFLEPNELKPFLAGTYFPPEDRGGMPGLPTLIGQVNGYWTDQRALVVDQADRVAAFVRRELFERRNPLPVGKEQVDRGLSLMIGSFDEVNGGWGRRNKFPMPVNLRFLMGAGWGSKAVRNAVVLTLDRMATGGMYDQVGGGFHRYSTDLEWIVPHFEKMLYDNGQLASAYAEAYRQTGDPYYAEIVRETLDYVVREMVDAGGAFTSAQDAEVNHREGGNYLWVPEEVAAALADAGLADDVDFALEAYGLASGTNFQDPHHPEDPPKNVVRLAGRPADVATSMGITLEDFQERLRRVNRALLAVRSRRDQPSTDDKVLTGWNGLMIAGLADGGRVLEEPRYLDAARRAVDFILTTMQTPDGGLLRSYRAGKAKIDAFTEDYAYFVSGLIALHRATGDADLLGEAERLAGAARERFWDAGGAYFDTLAGQADLFVRVKTTYDGALPSANGVMLHNLIDLYELTGKVSYLDDAEATVRGVSRALSERPTASISALFALHRMLERYPERLVDKEPVDPPLERWSDLQRHIQTIVAESSVAEVALAPGATVAFEVSIRLAHGFHLNAHHPGLDFLIPLELSIQGEGIELAVDYPDGERFDGPEGVMYVHHERVTIPVRVTRVGDLAADAKLMLSYQVCDDRKCVLPATTQVPVRFVVESSSP